MHMGKRLRASDYRVQSVHIQCREWILTVLGELKEG